MIDAKWMLEEIKPWELDEKKEEMVSSGTKILDYYTR